MLPTYAFVIVLVLSFSVSLVVTPLAIMLGRRFGIVDQPGGRRTHQDLIPRIGGVGIFAGFLVASVAAQFLPVPRFDPNEIIRFIGLILGGSFIFSVGLLDDILEFGPVPQFVAQGIATGIAITFLIFIERVNNPFTGQPIEWGGIMTVGVTVLWLGLMMNTVNFLDGLDGLASGVSLIAGLMLFVNSAFRLVPAQTSVSLLPLALVGACLGFLMYNFNPARVFMGSSGAYFLGYAIGTLSIIGGAKMATILLVMGLPLLDVVWQVVNRMSQGRNPFHGDRGHLHFRLVDMGYNQRLIVLSYYLFCTFFGVLTLIITSRLYKMVALVLMTIFVVIGFYLLKRMEAQASSSNESSPSAG